MHKFDSGLVQWMHRYPGLLESDLIKESGLDHWEEKKRKGEPQHNCVRGLLGELEV